MIEFIKLKRKSSEKASERVLERKEILSFSSRESKELREETMFKQVALLQRSINDGILKTEKIADNLVENFDDKKRSSGAKLRLVVDSQEDESIGNIEINNYAFEIINNLRDILQIIQNRTEKLINLLKTWCGEYIIDVNAIENIFSQPVSGVNYIMPHLNVVEDIQNKFVVLEKIITKIITTLKHAEIETEKILKTKRPINDATAYKDIYTELLITNRITVEGLSLVNSFIKKLEEEE